VVEVVVAAVAAAAAEAMPAEVAEEGEGEKRRAVGSAVDAVPQSWLHTRMLRSMVRGAAARDRTCTLSARTV